MKYEIAEMDIVKFNAEDVITTSGETGGFAPGDNELPLG